MEEQALRDKIALYFKFRYGSSEGGMDSVVEDPLFDEESSINNGGEGYKSNGKRNPAGIRVRDTTRRNRVGKPIKGLAGTYLSEPSS